MTMDIDKLSSLEVDVLKEIGNIGTGNAVTALAKMMSTKVDMAVPKVNILKLSEVSEILGEEEQIVVGILLDVSGDIKGDILFILKFEDANALVEMLMQRPVENKGGFNEFELSALKEVGNILAASYVSAIATLANMRIYPSVPAISIDMAGAILSVPAIEFGKEGDTALYIETQFVTQKSNVLGDFFLIPEVGAFEKLLRALGVIS